MLFPLLCFVIVFLHALFLDEPVQPSLSSNESMPSYCKNDAGDIFLTAESWKPNVCASCVCIDGAISCYSESCPPVSCERPVLRKGQCCPYCIGKWLKQEKGGCDGRLLFSLIGLITLQVILFVLESLYSVSPKPTKNSIPVTSPAITSCCKFSTLCFTSLVATLAVQWCCCFL